MASLEWFFTAYIRSSWIHFQLGSNAQVFKILAFEAILFTLSRTKLSLKLSLKLVEFKSEKVIILPLSKNVKSFLTPPPWRVVLVCPNSRPVSAIISYTNMAATSHVRLFFWKSKVKFCWIWTLPWRKN